jgi:hypothetical protein
MAMAADAAATAAGYVLSNYKNRYYVLPSIGACGWAGLAYIGYPYQAWSNGYNALWVYGHELGHNFTLWHAGSLSCSGQVIGGGCSVNEYGDPFDVMGNVRPMHFNSMQKSVLNWIPATSVKTHSSGTASYTLSPIESPGQSTYAVKIPASPNRTYWIEFRQPIGFDAALSGLPNLGAQIRVSSPFDYPCTNCGGDDTEFRHDALDERQQRRHAARRPELYRQQQRRQHQRGVRKLEFPDRASHRSHRHRHDDRARKLRESVGQ